MESERAFLKALLVGTVTTISVWAVLLYFVHPVVDELIGYVVFVFVTLVFVVPFLYRRYLQEGKPKQDPTPNRLRFAGVLYVALGLAYLADVLFDGRHYDRWYVISKAVFAFGWMVIGVQSFLRASKSAKQASFPTT